MARDYAYRHFKRYVKATRRLKEDRAEHGNDGFGPTVWQCSCFDPDGRTFSRFADHPQMHSNPMCCGNQRAVEGPTLQEKRHALSAGDWDYDDNEEEA